MPQNAFLVLPSEQVVALSPVHTITKTEVRLNPADSHYLSGGGDNIQVMLSKSQIEQLMAAANLTIIESKMLYNEDNKIMWQVTGEIEQANGDRRRIIKSYELDLRHKERDGEDGTVIRVLLANRWSDVDKARKDSKKKKWWMPKSLEPSEELDRVVREGALRELEMMDRHRLARAETGATLRVGRSALSIRSSYDKKELETTPFIVYRASFDVMRAIKMGGQLGQQATKMLSMALGRQLGIDTNSPGIAALLAAESGGDEENEEVIDSFRPLSDEEVSSLATMMEERGMNRSLADRWSNEIFKQALSGLTPGHIPVIEEYIDIVDAVNKAEIEKGKMAEIISHTRQLLNFAYANSMPIVDLMEAEYYNMIFPQEEEAEEEVNEEAEEAEEAEAEEAEIIDGEATVKEDAKIIEPGE